MLNLSQHPFDALVLTTDAGVDTVAEVFVRINGQGAKLNQADFILTLMSVFWEEGRKELENFTRTAAGPPDGKPSPRNYFIEPSPDQMLRVMVGLGLKRGKLGCSLRCPEGPGSDNRSDRSRATRGWFYASEERPRPHAKRQSLAPFHGALSSSAAIDLAG